MHESSLGRLLSVLWSPLSTFDAIRRRPTWVVALVAVTLIGLLGYGLMAPRIDFEAAARDALARQGQELSDSQLETVVKIQSTLSAIFAVVGAPLFFFLVALLFWVGFKVLGADLGYSQSLSTTLHAMVPLSLQTLLSIPAILSRNRISAEELQEPLLPSHLGILASSDTEPAIRSLLSSLNVFSLWTVALLIVGFAVVAGVRKRLSAGLIVGLWLVWIFIKIGLTSLQGAPS